MINLSFVLLLLFITVVLLLWLQTKSIHNTNLVLLRQRLFKSDTFEKSLINTLLMHIFNL